MPEARIGTAGWSIPSKDADEFPPEGTSLERYTARFNCAEINSSFHRSHRAGTYERWAATVPEGFLFSVKLAKTITHQQRLVATEALVEAFIEEVSGLEPKAAVILVQLPPSLAFEEATARTFFHDLRSRTSARIACEPRHLSWLDEAAERLFTEKEIARVAADPAKLDGFSRPGGWRGLCYYRLHGSPVPYRSSYDPKRLEEYAEAIARELDADREVWCIFDNTASSAAVGNALELQRMLSRL